MTPEERILFAVTRQDFLDEHRETVEAAGPVRWEELAATAERHGVAPIAGHNLRQCMRMPAEVSGRLERAFFENVLVKAQEAERLARAVGRLRAAGFQVLLLKSAALDLQVYREPWVTTSKDSDLLLRAERPLAQDERELRRSLYRSGIECDLDRHHDLDMNGVLPIRYDRIWAAARPVSFQGAEAFVMAPEDLLLSLCVAACRKRFFRLKCLFDISETVEKGLDWDRFVLRAREDCCEGIAYAALLAASRTLGARVPAEVPARLRVSRMRSAVIRSLVERGTLNAPSPFLPYASYRWRQALRSVRIALTWAAPEHHRPPVAGSAL
jgi:Uncharacterised nucleotidyltransferase